MDQEKKYASFWLRFLAVAVDWAFITLIVNLFSFILLFFRFSTPNYLIVFIILLFTFAYNVFCIYTYGATLGKRFVGVEVVKEEGRLTLFEAMRREGLLKPVSIGFFGMGIVSMFFNQKKQTYYDKKLHLVVLVKTPLSFVRRVFVFLIGLSFALYLFSWTPFLYQILNFKNEQMKREIIDGLNKNNEIMEVINDPNEKEFRAYYQKKNKSIIQKIDELCSKRVLKIIDKKSKCVFEDLSLDSLKEVNKQYENAISGFIDLQTQVQKEKDKKFKETFAPSPEKIGWMRYTDPSKEYYVDYPKTFSAIDQRDTSIMFEKRIVTKTHGIDNYIFIQKGATIQVNAEEIEAFKKMKIDESAVIRSKEDSRPSKFLTFERLPDVILNGKKIKSFISKSVWEFPEGTILHIYIYEGVKDYIFGGLTDEGTANKDNISLVEFNAVISTMHFN